MNRWITVLTACTVLLGACDENSDDKYRPRYEGPWPNSNPIPDGVNYDNYSVTGLWGGAMASANYPLLNGVGFVFQQEGDIISGIISLNGQPEYCRETKPETPQKELSTMQ